MKQVLIKQGQAIVEETPTPMVEPGTVLVGVDHSCISIGTEMSGVKSSGEPLWKQALKRPKKVKNVLHMAAKQGIRKTHSIIQGTLSAGNPTGYSSAGFVLALGEGIDDLEVGDRVACAGAQCAHHAEVIRVPRNLAVPIPDNLGFAEASTVTLGAIALQGVRRSIPTLGESFVVMGLGVLGQLTVQLLKANGCRVIGIDLVRDRIDLCLTMGLDIGIHPDDANDIEQVKRLTDRIGADGVIITAATPSDQVISTAFNMCRKKGRVVLVGDVGLSLNRSDFYQKELDFFISTSYGPGRYDNHYEQEGMDYPVAYVRWTENRNMAEYLRLLAEKKVRVDALISKIYPIVDASQAYHALKTEDKTPLMVLLEYPSPPPSINSICHTVPNPRACPAKTNRVRIAVIGAGGFAKGMHLPNLQSLPELYHIQAIISRTGHNAQATSTQFAANYASTNFQTALDDPDTHAVLIATRHNLHGKMVLEALTAGKHVLIEKPLSIDKKELNAIKQFYENTPDPKPVLLTGFNRRFSAIAKRIKEIVSNRSNPMIMNYRMNAGYIPLDHWVHGTEGGGRNLGEACHIYDLFTYLTGSKVVHINAQAISPLTAYYSGSDNFVATLKFEDGSIATLTYTALGNKDFPKEKLEVYVDGKVLELDDYQRLAIYGSEQKGLQATIVDKGQKDEVIAFADTIIKGGEWPIPLWEQLQAMNIAFEVENQLLSNGKRSAN